MVDWEWRNKTTIIGILFFNLDIRDVEWLVSNFGISVALGQSSPKYRLHIVMSGWNLLNTYYRTMSAYDFNQEKLVDEYQVFLSYFAVQFMFLSHQQLSMTCNDDWWSMLHLCRIPVHYFATLQWRDTENIGATSETWLLQSYYLC